MAGTDTYDLTMGWDTFDTFEQNGEDAFSEPDDGLEERNVSVSDALFMSLRKNMKVDIHFISEVTGRDKDTVINMLRGAIYQNPDTWNGNVYEGWELSSEYISGNLFEKHKRAKAMSALCSNRFDENVRVLESYMNLAVYFDDVRLVPGQPFIPPEIIDAFIEHLFGKFISSPILRETNFLISSSAMQ